MSLLVGGSNGQRPSEARLPEKILIGRSGAVSISGQKDSLYRADGEESREAQVQTIPDLAMESSVGTRRGSGTLMPVKYPQPAKDEGTRRIVKVYKVDHATLCKKVKSDTDVTQESPPYVRAGKGQDDSSYAEVQTLRATHGDFAALAA
jgi:hypothetical protein